MTASTELLVHRGRLVERGPDGANTGNVLSTAAYMGRAALSPDMPVSALMGVQTLVVSRVAWGTPWVASCAVCFMGHRHASCTSRRTQAAGRGLCMHMGRTAMAYCCS